MSVRRMMLFTLGAKIKNLIEAFKTRVFAAQGEFEAETCLDAQLTDLDNKGLLDSASFVVTPNGYRETLLYAIEPDKVGTNLLRWSEDFTQTIWLKNGSATVTGNTVTAPDGTNTADTLQRTTTSGTIFQSSVSLTAGQTYTASIYLRADTNGTINIGMASGAVFLLRNITTSWQRYTFTFTQATTTNDGLAIFLQASNTLSSVYAWGAQLELGSTATDYISTTDRAIINGTIGDMSVTRATTGTRVNADGLIEQVPYNLLSRSEEFENASWAKSNVTITANSTLAPNGTLTADTITNTSMGNSYVTQNATGTPNSFYVASCYFKRENNNIARLSLTDQAIQEITVSFNLSTLTLNAISSAGVGWDSISYGFSSEQNGFIRLWLSARKIGPNSIVAVRAGFTTSVVGSFGYLWGAQLVTGTQPRDYFPTTNRFNVPRIDYSNGSCPSILVEPQRTNIALRSEEFENALWIKNESSIISNSTISPSGVQNADSFIENTATALHQCIFTTSAASGIYTATIYAKPNGRNWLFFNIAAAANYGVWFDIQNGVVGTIQSNITSASITNAGNGWYRCIITANTGVVSPRISVTLSIGNNNTSYLGNGTSGIFIWGAQLELGANATSYIPTTTAAVTRNADVISNTNMSTLIGQTEGTVFAEFQYVSISSSRRIIAFQAGTSATNRIAILITNTNRLQVVFRANSIGYDILTTTTPLTGLNKIALCYRSGDVRLYLNGQAISTNTNAFSFTETLSNLYIGVAEFNTVDHYNGTINSAALWKTILTDAQAIQLTTL